MPGIRRRGGRHVSEEVRESALSRLLDLRTRGTFRSSHVLLVAEQLGVTPRTVLGWLSIARWQGRTTRKPRRRLQATDADIIELAYHRGSVAAFHRARKRAGETSGADAWRRAFQRALSPGQRAGLVSGERALREFDTYLIREARFRNQYWEGDHTQLALRVVFPDGRIAAPWATVFVDTFSRAITGFAIAVTPSRESILAALRAAIMVEGEHGPFGGVPFAIRVDRGRDFLADALRIATGALAIDLVALPAYMPHLKGTIERTNRSIEQLLLTELPGFVHAARDRAGRPMAEASALLTLEAFVTLFAEFARWYNEERPHDSLEGTTPLQRWQSDPTPLHTLSAERLRHLMLVGVTRTVHKKGVRLDNRWYNCAELCGHVGAPVEVRHMPHHHGTVEIFTEGRHLGTAYLVDRMPPGEVRRLLDRRSEEAQWLARVTRAAEKQRRVRYAAMTEPGPAVVATAFASESTAAELSAYDDVTRRRLASRSLGPRDAIPTRMATPRMGRSTGT